MSITHAHVSAIPDDPSKDVSSGEWNADHLIGDITITVDDPDKTPLTVQGYDGVTYSDVFTVDAQGFVHFRPLPSEYATWRFHTSAPVGADDVVFIRMGANLDDSYLFVGAKMTVKEFILENSLEPPDVDINTRAVAFYLDPTAGSTKLIFKAKDENGDVKTGSVNLT